MPLINKFVAIKDELLYRKLGGAWIDGVFKNALSIKNAKEISEFGITVETECGVK